jgi:multidrug resistance efflux pump
MPAIKSPASANNKSMNKINQKFIFIVLIVLLAGGAIGGGIYYYNAQKRIYTDQAEISAPIIALSPQAPGTLEQIMVNPGDRVLENAIIAQVGDQLIKTKTAGIIISAQDNLGKTINPGEAVATMVAPDQLRLIAHLDENSGLNQTKLGQRVIFTVDAFGSKQYVGTVDEISQSSRQTDVVFNISGNRQIKQFDIKIRFNTDQYPELKNGMSAKVWIYKNE